MYRNFCTDEPLRSTSRKHYGESSRMDGGWTFDAFFILLARLRFDEIILADSFDDNWRGKHGVNKRSLTSSTFRLGMWKNESSNLSLTCVCRSGKQSLMFRSTSALSCEQIELPVQLSFDVPSLLWSHNDVSLSLTFAILESFASRGRRTSLQPRHVHFPATK